MSKTSRWQKTGKIALTLIGFFPPVFPTICPAEVLTVKSLHEIKAYIKPESWLVFDLDNTLFTPNLADNDNAQINLKATDGHYYRKKKELKARLEREDLAYRLAVDEWNEAVQGGITVVPLESEVPHWVKEWQDQGLKILGLTAREPVLEKATQQQLRQVGIDLAKSPVAAIGPIDFPIDLPNFTEIASYNSGILYVGRGFGAVNHKGKRFIRFLEDVNIEAPAHVIFVDDREEHVAGMAVELGRSGIPFDGFIYTAIPSE